MGKIGFWLTCLLAGLAIVATGCAVAEEPFAQTSVARSSIGFTTQDHLHRHYLKHGFEFGNIDEPTYLKKAQSLRDSPLGTSILEATRQDAVTTRFDRASGSFIAFTEDLTILTFFRPNDGERYFYRQINQPHD